jgi:hypothetical protein
MYWKQYPPRIHNHSCIVYPGDAIWKSLQILQARFVAFHCYVPLNFPNKLQFLQILQKFWKWIVRYMEHPSGNSQTDTIQYSICKYFWIVSFFWYLKICIACCRSFFWYFKNFALHIVSEMRYNKIVLYQKKLSHILWPIWTIFNKNFGRYKKIQYCTFLYLAVFLTRYKNFDTFV